jgi:heme-degrading monooxygenase HmoA
MSFCLVAFHYAKPAYRDEMIQRLHRAAEVVRTVPGCLDADCWQDEATGAIIATARWESKDACQGGFAALDAAHVDWQYDERESRPRDVFSLHQV